MGNRLLSGSQPQGRFIQPKPSNRRHRHPKRGYVLEIGPANAAGLDAEPCQLVRDVLRAFEVALGSKLTPKHRVVRECEEPGSEVLCRYRGARGACAGAHLQCRGACESQTCEDG